MKRLDAEFLVQNGQTQYKISHYLDIRTKIPVVSLIYRYLLSLLMNNKTFFKKLMSNFSMWNTYVLKLQFYVILSAKSL